jgi:molybdopterin molybdotransferase
VCTVIPVAEARATVLATVPQLPVVRVPVREALGLAAAATVVSPSNVPPFDNSAVDGYAVRAADVADAPVELDVIGVLAAGTAPTEPVGPGQAIRIMTGAPMPDGADAVVMVEDSEQLDGGKRVRLTRTATVGDALRPTGDDVREGQAVVPVGTELTPAYLGVLATMGVIAVEVRKRPLVGVLSTGDELVEGDAPLAPGQIRESNRTSMMGALRAIGCDVVDLGLVRDDEDELIEVLTRGCASCDALMTSGGVSMGDFDIVKSVLDRVGDMHWMQMAIKPAKPFAFGMLSLGAAPVPPFGLPGNPVSSLISLELLARPALRHMMGHSSLDRPTIVAIADDGLRRKPDRKVHYMRVHGSFRDDGRFHVSATGPQGSHQLAATAAANALAVVPDGTGVHPGGDVQVLWLG